MKLQQLLEKTFAIQSHSDNSVMMTTYVLGMLKQLNIPFHMDYFGNVIAKKGIIGENEFFPSVACHLDTVHDLVENYEVYSEVKDDNIVYSSPTGIGGDDKVGIAIVLWLLAGDDIPNLKAFFFQKEEQGCKGSEVIADKHFSDVGYIIEPDRRGNDDLITSAFTKGNKICSDEFLEKVLPIAKEFKYTETSGSITDVVELATAELGISMLNLSCGYHFAHTSREKVNWKEVVIAAHIVRDSILELGENEYPHEMKFEKTQASQVKPGGYYYPFLGGYHGVDWDDDWEDLPGKGTTIVDSKTIYALSLGGHYWVEYLDAEDPDILRCIDAEEGVDVTELLDKASIYDLLEQLFLSGELTQVKEDYFFPSNRGIDFHKDDYYND